MLWFVVIVRQRTDQRESKGIGWVKKELILHMHIDMADRRGARIYFSWLCRARAWRTRRKHAEHLVRIDTSSSQPLTSLRDASTRTHARSALAEGAAADARPLDMRRLTRLTRLTRLD